MKKTLIVFPSWTRDSFAYSKLIKTAPQDWNIYVIDYSRFFENGKFDFEGIHNEIDKLPQNELFLIGHSLGGTLAIEYSSLYPEKIKRIFLTNPKLFLIKERKTVVLSSLLKMGIANPDFLLINLKSFFNIVKTPIKQFRLSQFALHNDLKIKTKTPVTIIWGSRDRLLSTHTKELFAKYIPQSTYINLSKYGHGWLISHPEKFWKISEKQN